MLSHAVCQSMRRILASAKENPTWSRRAIEQFSELRDEYSSITTDATSLVRESNGKVRWWTFAGGVANTLLAGALKSHCDVKSDNLSLSFPTATSLDKVEELIRGIQVDAMKPIPDTDAVENLKFSECLSSSMAVEVFVSRFDDHAGVTQTLAEPRRLVKHP